VKSVLIEACVDSAESAVRAARGGAGRIELCANLVEGGTTPSAGTIAATLERVDLPIMVMVRPRGGDFLYSELERDIMLRDVEAVRAEGADGVVFGALTADGRIDGEITGMLTDAAGPLPVTFHRAFDVCRDPHEALEALISTGVDRILTSGQKANVIAGLPLIRALVQRADGRIGVLPGGGIDASNVGEVASIDGIDEVHVYAGEDFASPMEFRNDVVIMGRAHDPDEYLRTEVSTDGIRRVVEALKG